MGTEPGPGLSLSVVIPVLDEEQRIGDTIGTALAEARNGGFDAEVVVVDDGSRDGSAAAAEAAGAHVLRQENRGRLAARRAGLDAATGEHVLLLDSRIRVEPGSLAFVAANLGRGRVWNAHAHIESAGNPYGRFWDVLSSIAFARYFDDPRTTSFGLESFDAYPKGTTCFFAPRALLQDAFAAFESRYADSRHANDDTPLIRWIAERTPVWISPEFACLYRPRTSLRAFVRHAFHRGIVFVDGHGRRGSAYRPVVLAFYPASVAALAAAVWAPLFLVVGVAAAAAVAAIAKRRPPADVAAFGALAPVYAVSHGLGMWRALTLRRS